MLKVLWLGVISIFIFSICKSQDHKNTFPKVVGDSILNHYFKRNDGWNGGDAAYSVLLPDGRILWTFGDTFYGLVGKNRERVADKNRMVRNSAVVQDKIYGNGFRSLNPIVENLPATWVHNKNEDETRQWYWPLAATVYAGKLQMLFMHMIKTGEGMWGFASESIDLVIFSLPGLQADTLINKIADGTVSFGSAILNEKDGYTYLYGRSENGRETLLHVARVAFGDLTQNWQYWNGKNWQEKYADFAIHQNVSSMFSVWENEGKYYLFTQESMLGRKIFLFESKLPVGPFVFKKLLYEIPEEHGSNGMISYNAIVHHAFSGSDVLVVGYSKNPVNFQDNFEKPGSADKYLPEFIRIRNWKD
jgi:hypothetical protein